VTFSPDGKTLAAGGYLWAVSGRTPVVDSPRPGPRGDSLAFSPDGKTLAAGYARSGGGSGMVLWDVAARKRMAHQPLPVRLGVVRGLAFSPDGKTLATGYAIVPAKGDRQGNGGGVILWDAPER
jgi:WD40 repeat protein